MPVKTVAWQCRQCESVHRWLEDAEKCEDFHGSIAERHQIHYRSCNCLGDSAECCDSRCGCHEPVR